MFCVIAFISQQPSTAFASLSRLTGDSYLIQQRLGVGGGKQLACPGERMKCNGTPLASYTV